MKEVNTIEAATDLKARDPIDVIAGLNGSEQLRTFDVRPKSSFEVVWDLAH